jgi:hypothetical protein
VIAGLFRRLILGLVAGALFATCAAVIVVALAFAFYAFLEPFLGRAGAAASLAGLTGVILGLGGFFLMLGSRPRAPRKSERAATGFEHTVLRAFDYLKERPLVGIAIAAGAGFLAIRNPAYLGSVLRSMLEGEDPSSRR